MTWPQTRPGSALARIELRKTREPETAQALPTRIAAAACDFSLLSFQLDQSYTRLELDGSGALARSVFCNGSALRPSDWSAELWASELENFAQVIEGKHENPGITDRTACGPGL